MTSVLISMATKIVEYPVQPILRHFDYLFDFSTNLNNLIEQANNLKILHHHIDEQAQRATTKGDLIEPEFQRWLKSVDELIERVSKIEIESKIKRSCFYGLCPNCIYRYRVSRKSTKMAVSIGELREKGNFVRVSTQAPLPGIEYLSSRNFIAFDSRKETMNQIIEALLGQDRYNSVVVVQGPKGIGKSELVKLVGKTVKKEKMFDEVVIAFVSPNSSVSEFNSNIRSQIADSLGLKFQEESEIGRARRLFMRLKNNGNRILIILDGVKEKLDLEAIGIPKECKILITTENEKLDDDDDDDGVMMKKKIEIQALTEEESWKLFKSVTGEIVENPDFKDVAEEIVGKCKGLPLMIVTVGKRLKNKRKEDWKDLSRIIIGRANTAKLYEVLDSFA